MSFSQLRKAARHESIHAALLWSGDIDIISVRIEETGFGETQFRGITANDWRQLRAKDPTRAYYVLACHYAALRGPSIDEGRWGSLRDIQLASQYAKLFARHGGNVALMQQHAERMVRSFLSDHRQAITGLVHTLIQDHRLEGTDLQELLQDGFGCRGSLAR